MPPPPHKNKENNIQYLTNTVYQQLQAQLGSVETTVRVHQPQHQQHVVLAETVAAQLLQYCHQGLVNGNATTPGAHHVQDCVVSMAWGSEERTHKSNTCKEELKRDSETGKDKKKTRKKTTHRRRGNEKKKG